MAKTTQARSGPPVRRAPGRALKHQIAAGTDAGIGPGNSGPATAAERAPRTDKSRAQAASPGRIPRSPMPGKPRLRPWRSRRRPPSRPPAHPGSSGTLACPRRPPSRRLSRVPAGERGTPRIVRAVPSGLNGAPAARRLTLETCQPSGPDGEGQAKGQARNAHGEPSRPTAPTRTGTPEPTREITECMPPVSCKTRLKLTKPSVEEVACELAGSIR